MIAHHTHKPTITLDEWLKAGLSFELYKSDRKRGYLQTTGRAAYGKPVEILWHSLHSRRKDSLRQAGIDPENNRPMGFEASVLHDDDALAYYRNYRLDDGRTLPPEVVQEYYANACVLNAIGQTYNMRTGLRHRAGKSTRGVWEGIAQSAAEMDRHQWNHTLPANPRRLKERLTEYQQNGYPSLIHKGFGNQNRRKVTGNIERLLLSLYCHENKPYVSFVHELYHQFLGGVLDIVDIETGELFTPEDFRDDHGRAIEISDSTVWNYINLPHNRRLVDRFRSGKMQYNGLHRPHAHRKPPVYSLSKISMDDRDLPRLMANGKRVKAYYSYDVASGAVIGASYSHLKNEALFMDCLRDMFRFIDRHSLAMPYEVEVEHHLVRNFRDELMKAGNLFPFVRWCNPGNSQEKRAEHGNRVKKLGTEKKLQAGIGRPFAKSEAHRSIQEKVFDENNDTYKTKTHTFEQLVADDMRANEIYNNSLHPNQKKYPKMTRLDVLKMSQNPNLQPIDRTLLMRYIGNHTTTTIRRNQYVQVQYEKYQLSHPDIVSKLQPNNLTVDAYWLPADDGSLNEIYMWQNGEYIDCCNRIERFQEAEIEKTDRDREIFTEQQKYISQYDKSVKEAASRLAKVKVSDNTDYQQQAKPEVVELVSDDLPDEDFPEAFTLLEDYASKGIENI